MENRPLYGLLSYDTNNLGDEIQSIAALRFLPQVDLSIPREAIDQKPNVDRQVRMILNGWFMHQPTHWPPHAQITPLLLSMHLNTLRYYPRRIWDRQAADILTSRHNRAWLRTHEPIGARDRQTLALLRRAGVKAWFSGCLTLTLKRRDVEYTDNVIACDLSPAMLDILTRRMGRPPTLATHKDESTVGANARLDQAEKLLRLYAGARAVITTRLHAALPCLAMGTPVLFIHTPEDFGRQALGVELAHHVSADDFLAGRWSYDLIDPPANPTAHLGLAEDLERRAKAFVGPCC